MSELKIYCKHGVCTGNFCRTCRRITPPLVGSLSLMQYLRERVLCLVTKAPATIPDKGPKLPGRAPRSRKDVMDLTQAYQASETRRCQEATTKKS